MTSGTQGQAEQFALFAAAEYAVATNLTEAGTGRFSRAVLEELQAQPLWPNMPELTSKIKANFRDQQHLEPVFWSVSLGSGDREVTDTISRRIMARQSNKLIDVIDKANFSTVKKKVLTNRLTSLMSQYEALSEQYDESIDAQQKIILKSRTEKLEQEIISIEMEINRL